MNFEIGDIVELNSFFNLHYVTGVIHDTELLFVIKDGDDEEIEI
jgi:hypothetical protein